MSDQKLYLVGHHEVSRDFARMGLQTRTRGFADYHKIGIATEPRKRLANMKPSTPHELRLVTTVESDDAKAVEKSLHKICRYGKHRGEWFKLTQNTINSLKAVDYITGGEAEQLAERQRCGDFNTDRSLYVELMEIR